jgi:hypothetical protein
MRVPGCVASASTAHIGMRSQSTRDVAPAIRRARINAGVDAREPRASLRTFAQTGHCDAFAG